MRKRTDHICLCSRAVDLELQHLVGPSRPKDLCKHDKRLLNVVLNVPRGWRAGWRRPTQTHEFFYMEQKHDYPLAQLSTPLGLYEL